MHSACNHLLLYNRPFSENHQFGVSLRNSSANIWKRSDAGIHVKSKADFKKFLSLWFDIQFTQYVFSPDPTWVRQISNAFARSRIAFFRGCFVCVWHCHVCQTSSQKDHCMSFYLMQLPISGKDIQSYCLFDCNTQPSTLLLFNKKIFGLVLFFYSQPFRWKSSWKVTMFFSFDRNYYTFLFSLSSCMILFSCATGRGA